MMSHSQRHFEAFLNMIRCSFLPNDRPQTLSNNLSSLPDSNTITSFIPTLQFIVDATSLRRQLL